MNPILFRWAAAVVRWRFLIVILAALATVLLGSRIGSLKLDMDPDIWAPQAHPFIKTTKELERTFGGRHFTLIGITPVQGDIYQPAVLEKLKRIQDGVAHIEGAVPFNTMSLAARKVRDIHANSEGMSVKPMLDPMPRTPAELASLKAAVAASPFYINTLVSPDGRSAAVLADFRIDPKSPSYVGLYKQIRAVIDPELKDGTVRIATGGLPVHLSWIEHHMMRMPLFFLLALVVIMAVQYFSFRSIQGMVLPLVTGLLSVIWALGTMGLLGVHMDAMNTNTPILIMAVAAGHAIQILKRYYEEYHRLQGLKREPSMLQEALARVGFAQRGNGDKVISQAAMVNSLAWIAPIMVAAGLIAMLTFLSLVFADISVVQHFGIFAGCGIAATLLLELTLIPALRAILPAPKVREQHAEQRPGLIDRALTKLADGLLGGKAALLLGAGLAVVALAFVGVTRLQVDNSLLREHLPGSEVRVDDEVLNRQFGGTNSMLFLVKGQQQDAIKDPAVLRAMAGLQRLLEQQPGVGKTVSIADMLMRMNQAMHGDNKAAYALPEQRELVAQYLLLYSMSGEPQDFDNLVDSGYQRAVIQVLVKDDSTHAAEALYAKARSYIDQHFPPSVTVEMGGSLPQTIAINDSLVKDKAANLLQMTLVVFVLASLVFRSPVGGLFVALPLLCIVLANLGLMGWLGIPLDMGTATTASMAIGIGADYEIYLLFRFREEWRRSRDINQATRASLATSGKAIIFVALSIAGGYSVLLASGFGFYLRFGLMVIATMVVSTLTALVFLRAMMVLFRPNFVFGDTEQVQPIPKIVTEAR